MNVALDLQKLKETFSDNPFKEESEFLNSFVEIDDFLSPKLKDMYDIITSWERDIETKFGSSRSMHKLSKKFIHYKEKLLTLAFNYDLKKKSSQTKQKEKNRITRVFSLYLYF